MYVRIVTFGLAGITPAEYRARAEQTAPGFRAWPGLVGKVYLDGGADGRYGGVYLFADRAAADASRETVLFAALVGNPAFADLRIEEHAVLDTPTWVTTEPVAV
jgi:hypothetical protein